jgi:prevent-host-death family protein
MQSVAAAEANRQFSALLQQVKKGASYQITSRGEPVAVLMAFARYKKVKQAKTKIADLLAMPGIENIPFDIPVWTETARPAEFS